MPKHTRKLRKVRRRGGDENYVVPKQFMPANEDVKPLLDARANLKSTKMNCATRDAFNRCVAGRRRRTRRQKH
jgi:hypothetical protein